ncbi:ComEA family DNA-binding protein [Thalassotalea sediminis]|uniref:ComEA family DNA-binding protein n=1 Tax=Thalassotalea sediminis TaxID=1759089 RepID=UPI00257379F3|nr:ComEA family DNA-binding protein [Thalassotalea sediminis]
MEFTTTIKDMMMKIKTLVVIATLLSFNTFADESTDTEQTSAIQPVTTKIALNKADAEQLSTLKGIGVKKAQAIILYRQQMGEFQTLEDLLNVKGIGKKVLADNQAVLML